MKQVSDDALRQEPYRLTPHESAVRPGFELAGFNRRVDELEDEAIIDEAPTSL